MIIILLIIWDEKKIMYVKLNANKEAHDLLSINVSVYLYT